MNSNHDFIKFSKIAGIMFNSKYFRQLKLNEYFISGIKYFSSNKQPSGSGKQGPKSERKSKDKGYVIETNYDNLYCSCSPNGPPGCTFCGGKGCSKCTCTRSNKDSNQRKTCHCGPEPKPLKLEEKDKIKTKEMQKSEFSCSKCEKTTCDCNDFTCTHCGHTCICGITPMIRCRFCKGRGCFNCVGKNSCSKCKRDPCTCDERKKNTCPCLINGKCNCKAKGKKCPCSKEK